MGKAKRRAQGKRVGFVGTLGQLFKQAKNGDLKKGIKRGGKRREMLAKIFPKILLSYCIFFNYVLK